MKLEMSVPMDLNTLIRRSMTVRQPLIASGQTTAYRLVHGRADGLDGLVIEQFKDVLIAQFHSGRCPTGVDEAGPALDRLRSEVRARAVYRKVFVSDRVQVPADVAAMHVGSRPWLGEVVEPELVVRENGLQFLIRPYDGFSVGLFLEQRDNRRRIRDLSAGRRVLNVFSYTCAFSVAAAAGGARSVSSVDLSRRYLEWGKRNFKVNKLALEDQWFFCSDVFDFYRRARRQKRRYDLIILDAPTFARARRPRRTFSIDEDLGRLLSGALELLDQDGIVLLGTNARQIPLERLEQQIRAAAVSRACTILDRPALPADFAGDPNYSKTVIARIG